MDLSRIENQSVHRVTSRALRSEHVRRKPTSYLETLIHFIKANTGAGILAMGDAYGNAGILLAPILTIVVGVICVYCQHIIVIASNFTKEKFDLPTYPNYPEAIDIAFETGSPGFKRSANIVRVFVKLITIVTQLGFCTVYVMIASESTQTILHSYGILLDKRIIMAAFFIPIALTSIIRSLKFLTPVSLISTFFLVSAIVCTLYVSCHDLPPLESREFIIEYTKWPLFLGTVIFAFEAISLVIPLKNEMANHTLFGSTFGVLNVGNVIYGSFMITVGTIGFLKYGHDVESVLSLNIADHFLSTPVQIALIIGILLSYALQYYVAADLLWNEIDLKWGPFMHPDCCEINFRVLLVLLTFVCAAVIPKINKMISLIGAIGGTSLALIFPPLCDIGLRKAPEYPLVSDFNWIFYIFDVLSLILAMIGFVFGTYFSVKDLYIAFRDEGI